MSLTREKTGFITPEKEYKKLFLWGLMATLISGLFTYLAYSSAKNAEFSQLIVTEGILIEGYSTAQLQTIDNKTIYFPLRGGRYNSRSNYGISLKEFYNHKVKIWWYSNKPYTPYHMGNFMYQMEVEGKLVLTYNQQKARFSRNKYLIANLSGAGALFLFLFGMIGYISGRENSVTINPNSSKQ